VSCPGQKKIPPDESAITSLQTPIAGSSGGMPLYIFLNWRQEGKSAKNFL